MELTNRQKFIFLGLLALWLVYALLFTPSGDDWERIHFTAGSLSEWLDLMIDQYLHLNGRVVGNLLSFALMKPLWLRALVKTASVGVIAISLWRLAGMRTFSGLIVSLLLITFVPRAVHVQSYAWSAGFFNYVIPLAIVLAFFARWRQGKWVPMVCAFLAGFSGCLFVEHVTLYLFVLATVIFLYQFKTQKKDPVLLVFAVGVLIGTLLMAGSPVYHSVMTGTDWYRRVPGDAVSLQAQLLKNFLRMGPYILAYQVVPLLILLPVVIGTLVTRQKWADLALWLGCVGALAYLFIPGDSRAPFLQAVVDGSWGMIAVFLLLHFLMWGWLLVRFTPLLPKEWHMSWRAGLISWLFLYAPLTVVQPIGPRNYYAGTVALIFLCLVLLAAFRLDTHNQLPVVATIVLCSLMLWRGGIHFANTQVARERDVIIRGAMAKGQASIAVPTFLYPSYMHGNQVEGLFFHYYYEKPGDIAFHVDRSDMTPRLR